MDPKLNKIHKLHYNRDKVFVHIPGYIPKLHKHLANLKEFTKFLDKEEAVLSTINKNMANVDKILSAYKNKTVDKKELKALTRYVNDITTTIPNILNSFELCSISMYNGYKKILKEIYVNIDN